MKKIQEKHPIPEYEDRYLITKDGKVFSVIYKLRELKVHRNRFGYVYFKPLKNGIRKTKKIHRIIAQMFIPNPENKREVNHINGIKDDNRIENLEWVTPKENQQHAIKNGLFKKCLRNR